MQEPALSGRRSMYPAGIDRRPLQTPGRSAGLRRCRVSRSTPSVGSSAATLLAQKGRKVVVLEKEAGLAAHQTGRNSGVIHSGIYYKPGSLKAVNCREGRKALIEFSRQEGVAHERDRARGGLQRQLLAASRQGRQSNQNGHEISPVGAGLSWRLHLEISASANFP